jgi:hypothetical protein
MRAQPAQPVATSAAAIAQAMAHAKQIRLIEII